MLISDAAGEPVSHTKYDYLSSFSIVFMAKAAVQKLEVKVVAKHSEWDKLSRTSLESLWLRDLNMLERKLIFVFLKCLIFCFFSVSRFNLI